jgi:4-amino-4-deoxy-L-arabinose transferase-like glycosyltransferase
MTKSSLKYFLIAIFLFFSITSALGESLSFDEVVHVEEGLNAWYRQTFAVDVVNPPFIREIATIPRLLGIPGFFWPRMMIVLLGLILIIIVYKTVARTFGDTVALVSLFLLVFEPNMLAHNHYVTLDYGYTVVFFIAYISFLRVVKKPTIGRWILFSIYIGLALASKVSALLFLPLSMGMTFLVQKGRKTIPFVRTYTYYLLMNILIAVCILWGTYFFRFDMIIVKRDDANRVSSRLHALAQTTHNMFLENVLVFGENQKLPLGNYLAVLKNSVLFSKNNKKIFFLGNYYPSQKWYFLPATMMYKTPIPLLLLFGASIFLFIQKKFRDPNGITFFIPIPVILFISIASSVRPMIRYMLPMYPFLIIIAAKSIELCKTRVHKIFFILLCLWYAYGTVSESPHFIAYANELAGERSLRFEKFADSNLDWGQSLPDIQRYVSEKKPSTLLFSYFGMDNADPYGFISDKVYGSYKSEEICAFHTVSYPAYLGKPLTVISITNWYDCGYYTLDTYAKSEITDVVASFLIFNGIGESTQ